MKQFVMEGGGGRTAKCIVHHNLTLLSTKRRNTVEITEPVSDLLDMALRTVFFVRTRPDTGVASRALLVEGVRFGHQSRIFNFVGVVAVQADFRFRGIIGRILNMAVAAGNEGGVVIGGMMMTVETGNTIACIMFGMLK
jgi:hypothetical protein